jgi:LytS/YehU family sensor histidine kinase
MLTSAFAGAGLCSIGLSFEPAISTWAEFIQIYIVAVIAQITIYCVVYMINYTISTGNKMQEEKEKKHAAQFRYQKLKRQVNPHFLFNSLNALDCLVWEEKPEQASTYIHKLASVYRYMIKSEDEDFVMLSDELTFVSMYIDLLKVRFHEGFEVTIDVKDEDKARFVLPCSIQLLIENATKHNAVGADNPLMIKVTSDGQEVRVSNSIIPKVTRVQSTGLGHKYIRQQYLDLSGKEIRIEKTEKEYTVTLPLI